MDINWRDNGSLFILDLTGSFEVSAGETEVNALRSAIAELVAEGHVVLALHLAGLTSIDARGLGELVFAHNALRAVGGVLLLVAPSGRVRKLLSVTRLDTVLRLCESDGEAVDASQRLGMSHNRQNRTARLRPIQTASMAVACRASQ